MPAFLRDLPPAQRAALLIGIPLVALVVLVQKLRGGVSATVATEPGGQTPETPTQVVGQLPTTIATDAAVGVGELAAGLSLLTQAYQGVDAKLDEVRKDIAKGESGQPVAAPLGVTITVLPTGESWKQITKRHYGSTNPTGLVVQANKALATRHGAGYDTRLPGGAVVFMPGRNW